MNQSLGELEIAARLAESAGAVGIRPPQSRQRHLRTDRRANGHEQWQRRQGVERFAGRRHQILVQDGIGRDRLVMAQQVHQREGKIVEHVHGRHLRVEFDRVEQDRLPVDQHDIGKMQVTVTAAHETVARALFQCSADAQECLM